MGAQVNWQLFSLRLTLLSIWSLALFSFFSVSASALSHVFIIFPCIYFGWEFIKNKESRFSRSSLFLFGMILFGIISILFAGDITAKFKIILKLKYFFFGLFAIFPYQKIFETISKKKIFLILSSFLLFLSIGNIAGVHALFDGFHYLRMKQASDSIRAAGMYGMAITYGYGIEFVVILLLGLLVNFYSKITEHVNKYLIWIALITSVIGLYFSYTRGALLALIISLPFLFIKTKKKLFYVLGVVGVIVITAFVTAVFSIKGEMAQNRFLLKAKTESNMIRLSQYQAAIAGFIEKPITGWGYRNFEPNAYDIKERNNIPYKEFYGHAHNNYLEFLVSTGIFGFISIVCFVGFWLWEVWKREDDLGIILLPFVISFAFSGLFQNTINDGENMFVIMFLYSLSQIKNKVKI